jgi:hypothetical protein
VPTVPTVTIVTINGAAARERIGAVETGLLRDSDWARLDGELCRVMTLTPLGFTKGLPYASVELESPLLAEPTRGFVTHRLDFEHLSEAFSRRESEPNSEVLIIWTKRHLKRSAKLVSRFMPRMWVMLCRENTFELMLDKTYESELEVQERYSPFVRPIAEWKPSVME